MARRRQPATGSAAAATLTRPLARFAVVGSAVTVVDVAVYAGLRAAGTGVVAADLPALGLSSAVSWRLHRGVTFRGDPYRRWLDDTEGFAVAGLAGAVVDVAVVRLLGRRPGSRTAVAAKLAAVAAGGSVRWALHRRRLFHIVRADHVVRAERDAPRGELRLSVVVPAFDEAERIGDAVGAIREALAAVDGGVEIIVVDDGSRDATAARARAAGADRVLVHERNAGKGAAVRSGVLAARGRTVAFTDADLAYPPEQLRGLLTEVERGWDVVVGSRRHDATTTLVRARRLREVGGRVINWLTRAVLLGQYRDTQCGLKAFRADAAHLVFERSHIDGFGFDVELFVIAERNGLSVAELPVEVRNTARSTVHVARDGVRLVRDLFRVRRSAREGRYQAATWPHSAPK
jgi:putative flippase GtrA